MPAETLAPLLALPDFEIHCLQKAITAGDQIWLEATQSPITLRTAYLDGFTDTVALADQLDVVVTIDTAIAYLAGALAKPVNVMVSFNLK